MNPGGYVYERLPGAKWEEMVKEVRELAGLAAEVEKIVGMEDKKARRAAALKWIAAHKGEFAGKPEDMVEFAALWSREPPADGRRGLGVLERKIFSPLVETQDAAEAWEGAALWFDVAVRPGFYAQDVPGGEGGSVLRKEAGQALLKKAAGDKKETGAHRLAALTLLGAGESQEKEKVGWMVEVMRDKDARVRRLAARLVGDEAAPEVMEAFVEVYKGELPGEEKVLLAERLYKMSPMRYARATENPVGVLGLLRWDTARGQGFLNMRAEGEVVVMSPLTLSMLTDDPDVPAYVPTTFGRKLADGTYEIYTGPVKGPALKAGATYRMQVSARVRGSDGREGVWRSEMAVVVGK
jgi:hypothetical protein